MQGVWRYVYRAVAKHGKTIDFLLREHRDKAAPLWFLRKAIRRNGIPEFCDSQAGRYRFSTPLSLHDLAGSGRSPGLLSALPRLAAPLQRSGTKIQPWDVCCH